MKTDLKPIEIYAIASERWKDTNTSETEIDLWVNGYLECQAANRAYSKSEVLKTDDQIREEAKVYNDSLPTNDKLSISDYIDMAYLAAYKSAQSSMEAEIDRRANEKVEEWKKFAQELTEQVETKRMEAIEEGGREAEPEVFAYDHVLEIIEILKPNDKRRAELQQYAKNLKTSEGENQ
jgi:hypothetical protein